jgi:hypothetical protein
MLSNFLKSSAFALASSARRAGVRSMVRGAHSAPKSSADFIALENKFGAKNYEPLPVVLSRGEGALARKERSPHAG